MSLLPLILGQWIGWTTPVLGLLQSNISPVGSLSNDQVSWLTSLYLIGGICGTVLWSPLADFTGRKMACFVASLPALAGWGFITFGKSPALLLVGRFLGGLGGSGGLILAPLYIGEIAQERIRGFLGSFVVLAMNSGILISFVLGATKSYRTFNYICFSGPIIFLFLSFWMPETPYYLWFRGHKNKAEDFLLWFRGGNSKTFQKEIWDLSNETPKGMNYKSFFDTKGKQHGMIICLGLFICQQLCGILTILSSTSFIFYKSGSTFFSERATIIVCVIQLSGTFLSSILVERWGRKPLLLSSYLFMGYALTTVGFYLYFEKKISSSSMFNWIPVASLSIHVFSYSIGAGTVPFILLSETLPNETRGLANSIVILCGTLLTFIYIKIYPLLLQTIQLYGCFWFFSIFCYLGFLFIWRMVPETKGLSVQYILKQLDSSKL